MDSTALALAALVRVVSVTAGPAGGADVTLLYEGDPAAPAPPLVVDSAAAEARGPAHPAHAAWTIAWDAEIADAARFRDARQLALYFTTGLPPGDRANVVVIRGGDFRFSGWGTIDDLVRLRAPIDATLDPAKLTSTDADPLFVPDAGAPPGDESLRRVRVDVRAGVPGDVRVYWIAEGSSPLAQMRAIEVGRAQKDGPRFVADVRAEVARAAIATWHVARLGPDALGHDVALGADAGAPRHVAAFGVTDVDAGPAAEIATAQPAASTGARGKWLVVALGTVATAVALAWRLRRRG